MNIHEEIRNHLAEGEIVYSFALGRVGQIISCEKSESGFEVEICPKSRTYNEVKRHQHMHGVTTFMFGDDVLLREKQDANGKKIYTVVNKELA